MTKSNATSVSNAELELPMSQPEHGQDVRDLLATLVAAQLETLATLKAIEAKLPASLW
ncbi:hypothetical protein [Burkholderiaceae bacterium 26]|uniref:hypothetical protein n=1 Tax=Ralstonia holmesii TaxID=3058602 RepID=UPI0012E03B91